MSATCCLCSSCHKHRRCETLVPDYHKAHYKTSSNVYFYLVKIIEYHTWYLFSAAHLWTTQEELKTQSDLLKSSRLSRSRKRAEPSTPSNSQSPKISKRSQAFVLHEQRLKKKVISRILSIYLTNFSVTMSAAQRISRWARG